MIEVEETEDGELVTVKKKVTVTPLDALRKVLYDKGLDTVRTVMERMGELGKLVVPDGALLTGVLMEKVKEEEGEKEKVGKEGKKKRKK